MQCLGVCDDSEMIKELVANFHLEIVRQKLEESSQSLQSGYRKSFRVGKVHEDGSEAGLQKLLRETALMSQNEARSFVGDILDLGRWGVQ